MHPEIFSRTLAGRRVRTFLSGALVAAVLATAPGWASHATAESARSKSAAVPFRLMEATIRETHAALEAGTVTSEDLVKMYLARIAAFNQQGPKLNALIAINDRALAEARALDAARRRNGRHTRGLLYGVPILLKDNYDTFDMPTTAGSLSLATSVPPDDGYLVRRLRQAGAIFLGKTNLHEFAYGITTISSLGGQTLNPYDPTRNPGGSSGGTGAAVAANFAVFGMGTDTCGSIRIPSSHNSLVGLRATQGLFSRDGIVPLALTQDIGGPLARSVEDIAIVLDLIAGYDPNDPATAVSSLHTPPSYTHYLNSGRLRRARFGLLTDALVVDPADTEVANVIRDAAKELADRGATVIDVSIPDYTTVSNVSVIAMEFKTQLDQYLAATPTAPYKSLQDIFNSGQFHPSLTGVLTTALASSMDTPEYRARIAGRDVFKAAILKVMEDNHLDALIYPTIRQKPIPVPGTAQPGSNCRVSAQSGLPAISVPVGFTPDNLPVGMEFLGREFDEGPLLQFAYSWEQATHHRRVPPTTPTLEPRWSFRVDDGMATFRLDPSGNRFRFTGLGMDTFVYIDPGMETSKGVINGSLKDARWRIRYSVPITGHGIAQISVDDLWTPGGGYTLYGRAVRN